MLIPFTALSFAGVALAGAVLPQIPLSIPRATLPTIESLAGLSAEHADQLREHIASLPERRLVEVGPSDADRLWISEGQKALLTYQVRGRVIHGAKTRRASASSMSRTRRLRSSSR